MANLYRIAKVFKKEFFAVSTLHKIYLEQSGNPKGIPIIHLHGGPGSSSKPKYRKFYNPEKYRIIIFDQRGCGKSTPLGETRQNTTWDLVEDIEKIRKHLGIEKWVVSGGSWGSTLALAYAEKYPERVRVLIVRGIFLFRKFEMEWLTQGGAGYFFPEEWEKYFGLIPKNERSNLEKAYAKRILDGDKKVQKKYAEAASHWEEILMTLKPPKENRKHQITDKQIAGTKIFYHYEKNNGFLKEGQLLEEANKLKNIQGVIIQGRYDMVCPPISAWDLHKAWPKAEYHVVIAGHHGSESEIAKKLVGYTDGLVN